MVTWYVVSILPTIFQLDFETDPTVWYFVVFILFQQSVSYVITTRLVVERKAWIVRTN